MVQHPSFTTTIPDTSPDGQRLLEIVDRGLDPAERPRGIAERCECVGFEETLASRAIDGECFLEHGTRLFVAAQPAQRHAEAVQDQAFMAPIAECARQAER